MNDDVPGYPALYYEWRVCASCGVDRRNIASPKRCDDCGGKLVPNPTLRELAAYELRGIRVRA